jgi:hypothetical protein
MDKLKKLTGLIIVPLALLSGGCATTSPLMVPVRPSPMHTLKSVPRAKLRIPVIVELPKMSEVEKHMASAVKEVWDKDVEASLTKDLGTKVWWDPLDWEFKGNSLTAHMHVHYKPKKAKDGETLGEEIEKDVKVDVTSVLRWSKDWNLEAPDFNEKKEEAGQEPGKAATGEDEDQKANRKGERLLRKGTAKFHESLKEKTNFKERAKEIWKHIQEPISVGDDIWLKILPHSVSVSKSRIIPDPLSPKMETVFEIVALPEVIFGKKPSPPTSDLPPLEDFKPGPEGFHAQTNLKMSFQELNKLLTNPKTGLIGQPLPGSSSHNIKLTGIRLYGSGGQIVVEAQIEYQPILNLSSKPAQLTVYLLGTPQYHEKEQTIDFPDLDFDVKSSDFLVQMATFVDGGGMRDQLRQQAVIPVGKNLEKLKGYMTKMLNRPLGRLASLKTTVTSFRMEEALVSDYGIEGRVSLDGDAVVEVNW